MVFVAILAGYIMLPAATEQQAAVGLSGGMGLGWPIALGAMLLTATLIGVANGIMVVKARMNAFMVTLAVSIALSGFALVVGRGLRVLDIPDGFTYVGGGRIGSFPISVLFVIGLAVAIHVILTRTVVGRELYAVGSNRRAARAAGVNDDRVVIAAFIACGFLCGVAAWLLVGRLGTASAGISSGALFIAVAAAVIGGVSLYGGRGTVAGMLGGLLLVGAVTNALNLAVIPSEFVNVVAGAVILFAVFVDASRTRRQAR
jgi:simple sugar transport system permease protein